MALRKIVNPTEGFNDAEKLAWNKAVDFIAKKLDGYRDVAEDRDTGNYIDVIKMSDFQTFMNDLKSK